MLRRWRPALVIPAALLLAQLAGAQPGAVHVLTQHNDNYRTGANLAETTLNTGNVNAAHFGKKLTLALDGQMYAQPLVVSGLAIGGGTHNVVFAATEHNSVYAYDGDTGALYWRAGPLGPTVPSVDYGPQYNNLVPEIGITSTPVIDLTSNRIYVVAATKEAQVGVSAQYFYRLHALDLSTGAEKGDSPVTITAQVPGTGAGSVNGAVGFNPKQHLQRPALTLAAGNVYVAFGAHADNNPYHGWVIAYDAATLQQTATWCNAPNDRQGSVWMSGQGLLVDESNNLYCITGNGSFNAHTGGAAYGNSFVKLSTAGGGLTVVDYFTPSNQARMDRSDADLGASGPLGLPGTSYLVGGGKDGRLFIVDREHLGQYSRRANHAVQVFRACTGHIHGSPIYWQSPTWGATVYIWSESDRLKAYQFAKGKFRTRPVSRSGNQVPPGMPGGMLSISADGSKAGTGIVWASHPYSGDANRATVEGILRAFDATDLTHELWNSKMNDARDHVGNFAKFSYPTIANGKVYLATFSNQLLVYGVLP
jgi:hypothetical protein